MIEWILTSSLLIVLVIILRHCLKGKIVLRLQYGLWAIVLVRLLVPISFGESGFSVLSVLNMLPGYVVDRLEAVSDYPLGYVGYETPDLAITEPDMGRGQLSEEEQEIRTESEAMERGNGSCQGKNRSGDYSQRCVIRYLDRGNPCRGDMSDMVESSFRKAT